MKIIIGTLIVLFFTIFPTLTIKAAEHFTWPSTGYLGWRYNESTQSEGTHNGVDIWSNTDGDWNGHNTGSSNAVYAAFPGQIVYKEDINWHGFIVKHNDNLYTNYWHLRDYQKSLWDNVDENSILGYQDFAAAVHVHFTVSASSAGSGNIDPSPYMGIQLNMNNPNPVNWGTYVEHSTHTVCGQTDVTIQNQGFYPELDFNCSAHSTIFVEPNVIVNPGSYFHLYIN